MLTASFKHCLQTVHFILQQSAGTSRACVKTCAQRLGGLRVVQDSFRNTAQPTGISSISVLQDFQDFQLGTRPYGNPFV